MEEREREEVDGEAREADERILEDLGEQGAAELVEPAQVAQVMARQRAHTAVLTYRVGREGSSMLGLLLPGGLQPNARAAPAEGTVVNWNRLAVLHGRDGTLHERTPADYDIGYRSVRRKGREDLDGELFAVAWLAFARGDGARARERISALLRRRIATQPLDLPNAGSVFRNPPAP